MRVASFAFSKQNLFCSYLFLTLLQHKSCYIVLDYTATQTGHNLFKSNNLISAELGKISNSKLYNITEKSNS